MAVEEWNAAAFIADVESQLAENMGFLGAYVANLMKARAPRSRGRGHAGGGQHAADTITYRVRVIRGGVEVRVGATTAGWYLIFHEHGTSKMAAHPWARQAVFGHPHELVKIATRGIAR